MVQESNIDLRKIFRIVLEHWYWFVISFIVAAGVSAYYYFGTTQKFMVNAEIMIRQDNPSAAFAAAMPSILSDFDLGGSGKKVDDEIAIITSRDLMKQAIEELGLCTTSHKKKGVKWIEEYPTHSIRVHFPPMFLDTTFTGAKVTVRATKKGYKVKVKETFFSRSSHTLSRIDEPFESCIGPMHLEQVKEIIPGNRFIIKAKPMRNTVDYYREKILVEKMKKDSYIIDFTLTSDCTRRDVDLINKLIDLYNLDAVIDKNILATATASFIDERLAYVTAELQNAEAQVENYKLQNNIADLSTEAQIVLEASSSYQREIAEVETQLNLVNYIQEFLSDNSKHYSLIPANIGIKDEALIALITEYNSLLMQRMRVQRTATDSNPVIVQLNDQLFTMRQNIMASISSVKQTMQITRNTLMQQDNVYNDRIKNVPTQEREFIEVKRHQMLTEEVYLFLFKRREENAIMQASVTRPAKVVAAPQRGARPASPRLRYVVLIFLLIGGMIPAGILYLIYYIKNSVDTLEEFQGLTKLPIAGQIIQNSQNQHIAISDGENSDSAESFRMLRTNLKFMLPNQDSVVLLVTSSIQGEGKSYIADNTAISLAMLGKKVALVDLNFRKPSLAKNFMLSKEGLLTNYLNNEAYTPGDLIIPSGKNANLDLIPAGATPTNPNELLQTDKLDMLFEGLRKQYDYIIVDSAPVAMFSDTFLLDRISDMTLYISRADFTSKEMMKLAEKISESNRLKQVACVLNGVKSAQTCFGI